MNEFENTNQQEAIGLFLGSPEAFEKTTLSEKHFVGKFKKLFTVSKDLYEKYGRINLDALKEFYDPFDLITWRENCRSTLKQVEAFMIDDFIEREINTLKRQLDFKQIDVWQFRFGIDALMEEQKTQVERLTSDKFNEFFNKRDTMIMFEKFKKMNLTKIKQGDFVVIAAGTGQGKTALALNLASDLMQRYPILYINIELSEDVVLQRLTAINTEVTMNQIDNRFALPQREFEEMKKVGETFNGASFNLVTGSQTVDSIRKIIGSFDQDEHFIVIIDHIGRISSDKDSYERMTQTSIAIRNMALDFNCTIFGLCQLNRESHRSEYPSNSLLRDSGEIEQSARKVMFIWSKEEGENQGLYLWFTKNDSAPSQQIRVLYDKERQIFKEVEVNQDGIRL